MNEDKQRTEILRRRRRNFILSHWALGLVTLVTTMFLWAGSSLLTQFSYSPYITDLWFSLIGQADHAVETACIVQLIIWWQWKSHRRRPSPVAARLLAIYLAGFSVVRYGALPWYNPMDVGWQMVLVEVLLQLSVIALDFVLFAAAGAFMQFRFTDRTLLDSESGVLSPKPWTIRGIFAATLVTAVILTFMQWRRNIYEDANSTSFYFESDAVIAGFLLLHSLAKVITVLAAANRTSGGSWSASVGLLVLSVTLHSLGVIAWILSSDEFGFSLYHFFDALIGPVFLYLLSSWFFRRWHASGYSLQRVPRSIVPVSDVKMSEGE